MAKKNPNKSQSWTRVLARWRRSGQSVAAFCRRQRLSEPSFYSWRRRLGRGNPAGPTHFKTFLPVTVTPSPVAMAELVLRGGRVLRLQGDSSVARIVELIRALEVAEC